MGGHPGQSEEEEIWINKEIAPCPMEAAASTHTAECFVYAGEKTFVCVVRLRSRGLFLSLALFRVRLGKRLMVILDDSVMMKMVNDGKFNIFYFCVLFKYLQCHYIRKKICIRKT